MKKGENISANRMIAISKVKNVITARQLQYCIINKCRYNVDVDTNFLARPEKVFYFTYELAMANYVKMTG